MQKCKYCSEWYPKDSYPSAGIIKGKHYRRRKCQKCYMITKKKRSHIIRQELLNIKRRLACKHCGFDDHRALDFHHRDPKEKEFNVGDALRRGRSLNTLQQEIKKCDVLCANCHRIEHYFGD